MSELDQIKYKNTRLKWIPKQNHIRILIDWIQTHIEYKYMSITFWDFSGQYLLCKFEYLGVIPKLSCHRWYSHPLFFSIHPSCCYWEGQLLFICLFIYCMFCRCPSIQSCRGSSAASPRCPASDTCPSGRSDFDINISIEQYTLCHQLNLWRFGVILEIFSTA